MNNIEPLVGIGTVLPQGTVVSISRNGVTVEKKGEKSVLDFATVEKVAIDRKGK
jgi:hypothetical protein